MLAIAGGAEATFNEGVVRAWEAMRVLAKVDPLQPEACSRPVCQATGPAWCWARGRCSTCSSPRTHARARGARIYARVAGYGDATDATHISAPDAVGQAKALRACLRDAQLSPADVGYINAHGTATPAKRPGGGGLDRQVFGAAADQVPISSTKSLHGHLIGAAGAVELLAAIVALRDGLLAPTPTSTSPTRPATWTSCRWSHGRGCR